MIKPLLLLLLFLTVLNGFSQNKKQRKVTPPGTVQINDTLFIDQTEVANIHWREYLHYLNKFDAGQVITMTPDTSVWGYDTTYGDSDSNGIQARWLDIHIFSENYFRHPGFNNYPVVGISYEQATAFCNWRTRTANFAVYCKEKKIEKWEEHINDSFSIKFIYRLPTKQEWEALASGKLLYEKYPYGFDSVYKKWGKEYAKIANCIYPPNPTDTAKKCVPLTASVKSYFPNSFQVYNTIGNVAEMVFEKGIAKGGSFAHTLEECRIINNQHYIKPERWLGFRCVAVLLK